ncbi:MAG: hypothetical protein WBB82_12880 [Limnothrix sp.]
MLAYSKKSLSVFIVNSPYIKDNKKFSYYKFYEHWRLQLWAIAAVGHESLTKLREYLKEKFTYDAIKLVRAQWLYEQAEAEIQKE